MQLWFNALIPALFPYMILSGLVIGLKLNNDINFIFYPVTGLLKINSAAAYCILSGIFFGYPACALNGCMLVKEQQLDKETASFCACAFNNISPGFIMGYFCIGTLENKACIPIVLCIFYLSVLLSGIVIRIFLFKKINYTVSKTKITNNTSRYNFQNSIKSALVNISVLGGYVIIFSILINYMNLILKFVSLKELIILTPLLEITSGISNVCSVYGDISLCLLIIIPMLSFGGISGIFQTFAIDTDGIISKKKYIYSKIISGIISLIITYLTVYVFKIVP